MLKYLLPLTLVFWSLQASALQCVSLFSENLSADTLSGENLSAENWYGGNERVTNSLLDNKQRVEVVEALLARRLDSFQIEKVFEAHEVGHNEIGKDGIRLAQVLEDGTSNFTKAQILRKVRLLQEANFSRDEIRLLLDAALVGKSKYDGLTAQQKRALQNRAKVFKNFYINISNPKPPQPVWYDKVNTKHEEIYKGIYDFLENPARYGERLQELEIEILRLKNKKPTQDDSKILNSVLAKKEKDFGFGKLLRLEEKSYSPGEWTEMLALGRPFYDTSFANDGGHGALTHRIQAYIIMREIELNPEAFGLNKESIGDFVEAYKASGQNHPDSPRSYFYEIFDQFDRTARHPEFLGEVKTRFWPDIKGWN